MYFDEQTSKWVTNRLTIAWRYLSGMAIIDVVSTIPFDFIATIVSSSSGDLSSLASLRILRVLRLTKLLRVLRSSRVLKRLEDHALFHYSYVTLAKFAASTLLLTHWMACLFHLVEASASRCCRMNVPLPLPAQRSPSAGAAHLRLSPPLLPCPVRSLSRPLSLASAAPARSTLRAQESNGDPCNWVNAYFYYNSPDESRSSGICDKDRAGNLMTRYLIALYWRV